MLTDAPPRNANRVGFLESDRIRTLDLLQDGYLLTTSSFIESAMKKGNRVEVRRACAEFLSAASEFYGVPACSIRVLAARPLRVRENRASELFGDYDPENKLIRVWMRTAVRKDITSFGTFLSTLCHEFCHHLDFASSGLQILGTLVASMGVQLRFTTMHEARRQRSCSGCRCQVAAGGLTGPARIRPPTQGNYLMADDLKRAVVFIDSKAFDL